MPKIVLTQDISPKKGWTRGRAFDWARPTITNISRNIGNDEWFEWADKVDQRANTNALRKRKADAT